MLVLVGVVAGVAGAAFEGQRGVVHASQGQQGHSEGASGGGVAMAVVLGHPQLSCVMSLG